MRVKPGGGAYGDVGRAEPEGPGSFDEVKSADRVVYGISSKSPRTIRVEVLVEPLREMFKEGVGEKGRPTKFVGAASSSSRSSRTRPRNSGHAQSRRDRGGLFLRARLRVRGRVLVVIDVETIKTHQNVGGLPPGMRFKLVEPLRDLFKEEVGDLVALLGLPCDIIWRCTRMRHFLVAGRTVRVPGESEQRQRADP